jgi:hypothetical protein
LSGGRAWYIFSLRAPVVAGRTSYDRNGSRREMKIFWKA